MRTLVFLATLVVLTLMTGCKDEKPSSSYNQGEVQTEIEQKITQNFNNPEEARFRETQFASYDMETASYLEGFLPEASSFIFCGLVNGQNRYGAYMGFSRFVAVYLPPLEGEAAPEIDVSFEGNHLYESYADDCP